MNYVFWTTIIIKLSQYKYGGLKLLYIIIIVPVDARKYSQKQSIK